LIREYDYIIVGQGLAGSCLAIELLEQNSRIIVFNDLQGNSSSRVAGGLINPITGRKMVLTWKASILFPFLKKFYTNAENKLGAKFYFQTSIYRPFISVEEQNEWQGKSAYTTYEPFIKSVTAKSEPENVVQDPYGGLLLKNSAYLDTNIFLDSVSKWLRGVNSLLNEKFDIESLNFIQNSVVYKDIKARKIIFCNGVEGADNPFFSEIQFRPVKGEVLKIKIEPALKKIYNRGVFVMPKGDNHTVGSNYSHKDLTWEPTESGKKEIENKLEALLKNPYEVIGHRAGIRPSVSDRRPVLGRSKEKEQVLIFNGLGTKGVSLAPFFANQLVNWMCNGQQLDKDVNVNRFF
jgi:glycine oxidase